MKKNLTIGKVDNLTMSLMLSVLVLSTIVCNKKCLLIRRC